jgi:hypothetical protein
MKELKGHLEYLRLQNLQENLDTYLNEAESKQLSHLKFLKQIIKSEYEYRMEKAGR